MVVAGPRTSYEGVGKDGAMAQDLNRKWAADPGVVKAVCSTAPDIQTRPNFGFDEGPRLRAQIRQKGQIGDWEDGCGIRIEELFCSMG
jgi:hypothetical protein